jgi:arginine decarboxylase
MIIGQRVPRRFFITVGKGESDVTVHAGSYHLALKDAGIEMCNIMQYSSILPGIAEEVKECGNLVHGAVMETIMAECSCEKGEMGTAGIIYGWLYDKVTEKKYGGIVCEYHGHKVKDEAALELREALQEIYFNGFSDAYFLRDEEMIIESIIPKKQYGTVIVSICFIDYEIPVIER